MFLTDEIHNEAVQNAAQATQHYIDTAGEHPLNCGFAWVQTFVKGNTKLGRAMKAAGIEKSYTGSHQIYNPSGVNVQNVDVKEAGAEAAAKVFESFGFKAYAGSRLD